MTHLRASAYAVKESVEPRRAGPGTVATRFGGQASRGMGSRLQPLANRNIVAINRGAVSPPLPLESQSSVSDITRSPDPPFPSRPALSAHTMNPIAALAFAALLCCLPACGNSREPASSNPSTQGRLQVSVSIPPQAEILRRIGGDHLEVHTFVSAAQDPHHFSPTPGDVLALGNSRLFFTTGMPFEEVLVSKIVDSAPGLEIVDTARAIAAWANAEDPTGHDHAAHREEKSHPEKHQEDGDHDHDHETDFHYWLSPPLIKIQAAEIQNALARVDPANAAAYSENLQAFLVDIDALHARIRKLLAPLEGQAFYVYHPAFGHFAETYSLRQEAIETGGKSPTPKQLMRLITQAREDGAKIIFVQPQFDPSSAQSVAAAIEGRVVPIDPLAEDVLSNLETIARAIHDAMSGP